MLWQFLATGLLSALLLSNTRKILCSRDKIVTAQQTQKQNKLNIKVSILLADLLL